MYLPLQHPAYKCRKKKWGRENLSLDSKRFSPKTESGRGLLAERTFRRRCWRKSTSLPTYFTALFQLCLAFLLYSKISYSIITSVTLFFLPAVRAASRHRVERPTRLVSARALFRKHPRETLLPTVFRAMHSGVGGSPPRANSAVSRRIERQQ